MIDFHTHILPNMDDGSKSVEISNKLLNILESEGVKLVCLTSHFYPSNESVDDFLIRRDEAFRNLNYTGNLKLRLGSEVHYYSGICQSEEIYKLCIEGTNVLLLELSFTSPITDTVVNDIIKLKNRGFKVILAHIERYDISESKLIYLHNNGVLLQVNTSLFEGYFSSKKALKWLRMGIIDVIGSDCHDLDKRVPNYKKTMDIIAKKLGQDFLKQFVEKTYKIIG